MARVTRLVIGEKNFNDAACGFSFKASVCEPTEEIDDSHIRVRRLLALFPGSTVETTLSKPAPKEPEKKKPETKVEGPKPGDESKPDAWPQRDLSDPKAAPEDTPEPTKPSTVGKDDADVKAKLTEAAAEDHAAKASDETGELEPVEAPKVIGMPNITESPDEAGGADEE